MDTNSKIAFIVVGTVILGASIPVMIQIYRKISALEEANSELKNILVSNVQKTVDIYKILPNINAALKESGEMIEDAEEDNLDRVARIETNQKLIVEALIEIKKYIEEKDDDAKLEMKVIDEDLSIDIEEPVIPIKRGRRNQPPQQYQRTSRNRQVQQVQQKEKFQGGYGDEDILSMRRPRR